MDNEEQDGGLFFPTFLKCDDVAIAEGGISLRDWFAGQAISQTISHRPVRLWHRLKALFGWDYAAPEVSPSRNAQQAYAVADEMLAIRQRRIDFNARKAPSPYSPLVEKTLAEVESNLQPAEAATDQPSPPPLAGERL